MRLDKYLAHSGLGSRSQVKEIIKKGQVRINGIVAKEPGMDVNAKDEVEFPGKKVSYDEKRNTYLMMNKPKGYVCATKDETQKTVFSLLSPELNGELFPVGRLDKDTEGFLILTDDGEFCHRLISPKNKIGKTYLVECKKPVTDEDLDRFRKGIRISGDEITLPAKASTEPENDQMLILTIYEGKYHQVKRMVKATCNKVLSLKRLEIGSVRLDEALKPGEYRELTDKELEILGVSPLSLTPNIK